MRAAETRLDIARRCLLPDLRVVVLSHMFPRGPEDWGGIFVHEQVRALREAGVDARVITGDLTLLVPGILRQGKFYRHLGPAPAPKWRDVAGIPTLYFPYLAAYPPWWGRIAAVSYRREVKRLAKRVRAEFPFDLVHAHTAFLDGGAGAWLARRCEVPLILTEHTGPFSALTEQPMMRWQTERAINGADVVITVSETLKRDILARVRVREANRIQVLGNGVNLEVFRPDGDAPPDDGTVRALWIGGFLPVKQPLMLIDSFSAALRQDPRLRLSMVGTGMLEGAIRAKIQSRGVEREVSIFPSATRPMVADYMRRHHFLVISSQSETFGLVAIEALACGRPVLSTRCGGPEETVRASACGELVENSIEGLAKGFLTMSAHVGEFDAAGLHDYVRRNFGLDVIAARLKGIYMKVLEDREIGGH